MKKIAQIKTARLEFASRGQAEESIALARFTGKIHIKIDGKPVTYLAHNGEIQCEVK